MLMRIVLFLVQLVVAWFGALAIQPYLAGYLGDLGPYGVFVLAVLFAIIIFLVGLIASAVMRDISSPTSGTLVFSLILALIGAGVTLWEPALTWLVQTGLPLTPAQYILALPLLGAAIGYFIKR